VATNLDRKPWAVGLPPTAWRLLGGRTGPGLLARMLGLGSARVLVEEIIRHGLDTDDDAR